MRTPAARSVAPGGRPADSSGGPWRPNGGARYPTRAVSARPDLAALAARLPARPWTRFAPAPTGQLHLGHVANAIYVWGLARVLGGRVRLRIEDHDRQRCRPGFERALLDDLEWLGFLPDTPAIQAFRAGPCEGRQSDRDPVYREALAHLAARGLLYGCVCTRREIDDAARAGRDTGAGRTGDVSRPDGTRDRGVELHYPGTCRDAGHPLTDGVGWRVRLDPAEVRFDDGLVGPVRQTPARQCGDLLVRDRLGNWTYQFAVAVDDLAQDISLVVRGRDLLESTGRQILLARLLGRTTPPVFVHHPLVMRTETAKLSKSDGDTGVADLRRDGWTAARVIGEAAARVGLIETTRPVEAEQVERLFRG